MSNKYEYFTQALERKIAQNRYRQLRCLIPFDEENLLDSPHNLVNFNSNDFLGLASHSYVKKNIIKNVLKWGAGSTATRLLTQHLEFQQQLQSRLAQTLKKEKSLLFYSSFQAHSTIISALANKHSQVYIDQSCHSSLVQSVVASQAKMIYFQHNDFQDLEKKIRRHQDHGHCSKILISEAIFSLDGDRAPLEPLIEISEKNQCLLYIDDSQSFATSGLWGKGLASKYPQIDVCIGSFGKSCGTFGAFATCNRLLDDYIRYFHSSIKHIGALPPAILGAIDAALDLIPGMEKEREELQVKAALLRKKLCEEGFYVMPSGSQIVAIGFNNEDQMIDLVSYLRTKNFLVSALRAYLAPDKIPRIKLAINVDITTKNIFDLCAALRLWKKEKRPSLFALGT